MTEDRYKFFKDYKDKVTPESTIIVFSISSNTFVTDLIIYHDHYGYRCSYTIRLLKRARELILEEEIAELKEALKLANKKD